MDGSEADCDLVLIQTFLFYYVQKVILILTSIFQGQFPWQSKGGLYQNKVIVSLTFTRSLGTKSTTVKWSIRLFALSLLVREFLAINSQLS